MIKKIIISFTLILFFSRLFGMEWGGLFAENFRFSSDSINNVDQINTKQSNSIALWANIPFVNSGNWYLATQGSYKYNYYANGFNKNGSFQNIVDLELFKLNGLIKVKNSTVSLSMGRFFVLDATSKVFAQNSDGISVKVASQAVNFSVYAGYTGLVNGNNVVTLAKDGSVQYEPNEFYGTTHPYLPVSLTLTFPSIVLNQSLGLQANAFFDLGSENYNRLYGTISLQGPIYGPVYYSLNSCFGIEDYSSLSNLSILSFMAFFNTHTVKLNCEYASGDQLYFKPFKGFNSSEAFNYFFTPEYSGLLLPGLEYIFSLKDFYLSIAGKFVMLYPEDELIINGISANVKSVTNIYSDLAFDLAFNFYTPLLEQKADSTPTYIAFSTGLSLAF